MESKARKREDLRREILHAAAELVDLDGYGTFSMRKLAQRIEYSPTTIYHYFKGKDDLLAAICDEIFANFFNQLTSLTAASTDPMERMRTACVFLVRFGLDNPKQYKLAFMTKRCAEYGMHNEFSTTDSMAGKVCFVLKDVIEDAVKGGRLSQRDTGTITAAITAICHGIFALQLYSPGVLRGEGESIACTMIDSLLSGFQLPARSAGRKCVDISCHDK
jgi:AcrR family transcriptional regulator